MPATEERRKAQRFPLDLSLKAKWLREGEEIEEFGTVGDISSNGVYFVVSHNLKRESQVELCVSLKIDGSTKGGVLLHCLGRVVRVDRKAPERIGVAARIDRYRLLRHGGTDPSAFPEELVD